IIPSFPTRRSSDLHESINELVRVMGDLQGVLVLPDLMKASPHKVQCMAGRREIRVHIRGLWHGGKNAAGQPVVFQGLPGLYQIRMGTGATGKKQGGGKPARSEEHTSELQSRENLVCRLLLVKNKTLRSFVRLLC